MVSLYRETAKNKKYLEMLGITHLLNAAEGRRFGFVNTDSNYYADTAIKYYGIPVTDLPTADISKYFYTVADFIDEAMSTGGNLAIFILPPCLWYNIHVQTENLFISLR